MSKPPSFLIEMFGKPGSGKSTIARAVDPGLFVSRSELGEEWRRERVTTKALIAVSVAGDVRLLSASFRSINRLRLFHFDSIARLLRLAVKAAWLRRRTDLMLIEEGHLQDLWSIFFSAQNLRPDAKVLAPLVRCLYDGVDATIAFLDIGHEEVSRRIGQRRSGRSRLDRMDDAAMKRATHAARDLARHIAAAAELAGLRVEKVDASRPVELSVRAVQSLIDDAEGRRVVGGG